jgi:hypothetical protein
VFLVAFLPAESNSRAVFAAATIEFVADLNVCWKGGFPGALIVSVMLTPLDFAPHGFGNCQRAIPVPILRSANQTGVKFSNGLAVRLGKRDSRCCGTNRAGPA